MGGVSGAQYLLNKEFIITRIYEDIFFIVRWLGLDWK